MALTWNIAADLDGDGSFETDLTEYVERPGRGLKIKRGASGGTYRVSKVTIALSNKDGTFTPGNRAGSLFGRLETGIPIRITAELNGVGFTLATGYVTDLRVGWAAGKVPVATLTVECLAGLLRESEAVHISTSMSRDTDAAIEAVRTALGLESGDVSLDDGLQDLPYHYAIGQRGIDALNDAVRSEFGGLWWINSAGQIRFEARDSRLGVATVDDHWGDYPAFKREVLQDFPVGFWRLGEASGSATVADLGSVGTGTITLGSGVLAETGLLEVDPATSMQFDGAATKIAVADDAAMQNIFDGGGAVECLVNLDSDGGGNAGRIAEKRWHLSTVAESSANVALEFTVDFSSTDGVWRSAVNIGLNESHHIAVVYDSSSTTNNPILYVNGSAVTFTETSTPVGTRVSDAGTGLTIGNRAASDRTLDGHLQEVALYDHALTAARVAAHHAASIDARASIYPTGVGLTIRDRDVISEVRARVWVHATGQADEEFFRFTRSMHTRPTADSMSLTAGEIYEREFTIPGAYHSITAPVAGTDYSANDSADGSGTDRTSDLTPAVSDRGGGRFTLQFKNGHSGSIYVTHFRLRGQLTNFSADRPEAVFSKSISGFRKVGRGAEIDYAFGADQKILRDAAYGFLRTYRHPVEEISLNFVAGDDAARTALLGLELGQLIRYSDMLVGVDVVSNQRGSAALDDWFRVEEINLDIPPGWAGSFKAKVTLVPSFLWRNVDAVEFDLFDRDNSTGDLGTALSDAVWSADGNMNIASEVAVAGADSEEQPAVDLGAGATDQIVEVDLETALEETAIVGITMRHTDGSNTYRAVLDLTGHEIRAVREEGGTVWEIIPGGAAIMSAGVISQATRSRAVEGDGGASSDSTVALYPGSTNLCQNSGAVSDVAGWINLVGTVSRLVTTTAKFGAAVFDFDGCNAFIQATITGATSGRVYSVSFWLRNGSVEWQGFEVGGASPQANIISLRGVADPGSTWTRVTAIGSALAANDRTVIRVQIADTGGPGPEIDGLQIEELGYPSPVITTDGGTATRAAARLRLSASLVDEQQSWIAVRWIPGFSTALEPESGTSNLVDWGDGGGVRLLLCYDTTSNSAKVVRGTGSGSQVASASSTLTAGTETTFIGSVDATTVNMSVDGGVFNSTAGTTYIPSISSTELEIGRAATSDVENIWSSVRWIATGKGTLSDADAAILHAYGTTPPTQRAINHAIPTAKCTASVAFGRSIITPTAAPVELRAAIQDERVRVWFGRELFIDSPDPTSGLTGTKAGLYALAASGTVTFNDFYAQGL